MICSTCTASGPIELSDGPAVDVSWRISLIYKQTTSRRLEGLTADLNQKGGRTTSQRDRGGAPKDLVQPAASQLQGPTGVLDPQAGFPTGMNSPAAILANVRLTAKPLSGTRKSTESKGSRSILPLAIPLGIQTAGAGVVLPHIRIIGFECRSRINIPINNIS
jgi:hypothetical protein